MKTIKLTDSQVNNLKEFFEMEFLPSIQRNTDCDNIEYVVDMCDIYKQLKDHPTEKQIENDCSNCNRKDNGDPACKICVSAYDPFTNKSSTPSHWQPIPETTKGGAE